MSFEESVKAEIAYRLVSEFVEQRPAVARQVARLPGDLPESPVERLPAPKAQEVEANAYPPADARHWVIPVFHPMEFTSVPIDQPIGPIVDTVELNRELRGRSGLYAWVWSGYHERSNTIFFAVVPARMQAAVSTK